jgi:exoribonuclease R
MAHLYQLHIHSRDYSKYSLVSENQTIDLDQPSLIHDLFHNDIVHYESTGPIIKLHKRDDFPKTIAGELELYSKYSFKPNKKGVPTYIFTPLDFHYPKFLVSSTLKRNREYNQYITIEYSHWDKISVFPKGQIVKIYGNINDKKALQEVLISKHFLENKCTKHDFKGTLSQMKILQSNVTDRDIISSKMVSIDPGGCTDIDDAFSIGKQSDILSLDIHISDVYYLLTNLDLLSKVNNSTSIYLQDSIQPMLPTIISNNLGSLLEGRHRFMLSLEIKYSILDKQVISTRIRPTYGKITKNYSYENYPKRIDKFFPIVQELYKCITGQELVVSDSHFFIEALMIIYNTMFCKKLQEVAFTIYRIQTKQTIVQPDVTGLEEEAPLCQFLKLIHSHGAKYSLDKKGHSTLGIRDYTHATSPLRRMVDLMNQEIFYTHKSTLLERMSLDYMNEYNRRLKRCYREIGKVILGYNVYYGSSYKSECYLYQYNLEKKYVYLYFPKEKISIKTRLFSHKLDTIYTMELVENKIRILDENYIELALVPLYNLITVQLNGKPDVYYPDKSVIIEFKST